MHKQKLYYATAITSVSLLLALILIWNTCIAPSRVIPVALVLLLQAVPLLLPLRGLLHGKVYTYQWTSLLTLYYLLIGLSDAYSDAEDRIYGMIMTALSLGLFISSILYVRSRQRHNTISL